MSRFEEVGEAGAALRDGCRGDYWFVWFKLSLAGAVVILHLEIVRCVGREHGIGMSLRLDSDRVMGTLGREIHVAMLGTVRCLRGCDRGH